MVTEDEREIQSTVPRPLKPNAGTDTYRAVEILEGELGIYISADGSNSPARFEIRSPCLHNLSALPGMAEGESIADLIVSLGSLDTVLGSVDRCPPSADWLTGSKAAIRTTTLETCSGIRSGLRVVNEWKRRVLLLDLKSTDSRYRARQYL